MSDLNPYQSPTAQGGAVPRGKDARKYDECPRLPVTFRAPGLQKAALVVVAVCACFMIANATQAVQANWQSPTYFWLSVVCVLASLWVVCYSIASIFLATVIINSEGIQYTVFWKRSIRWVDVAAWRQPLRSALVEIENAQGTKCLIFNTATTAKTNDAIAAALNHFVPRGQTEKFD